MSKSNAWENALLQLLFNNVDAANIGDGAGLQGSAVAGNLYISLHTADPGEAGNQTTSEAAYTSYARVAVARSAGAWSVVGNAVDNVAAITFPQCTGGSSTITHFAIGTAAAGAGVLLYKGALTPTILVTAGITPQIPVGGLDVTED